MMMMMMMKFAVVLVLAVVPVVKAQTNICEGLSFTDCIEKEECDFYSPCVPIAGEGSVVRQGDENLAAGKFCTAGGGQYNQAGYPDNSYNVVGGGHRNVCRGNKNTIAGGNENYVSNDSKLVTISGGNSNRIIEASRYSVITGGGGKNEISKGDSSTISGGKRNGVRGSGNSGNTVTGGFENGIYYTAEPPRDCVITGGSNNAATGQGAVVLGGKNNSAKGDYSIALGENAIAEYDNSMAVNLVNDSSPSERLLTEQEGQFLMKAASFRFQIGNGGDDGIDSIRITYDNMDYLNAALEE